MVFLLEELYECLLNGEKISAIYPYYVNSET